MSRRRKDPPQGGCAAPSPCAATLSPDGSSLAIQYYDQGKVSVAIWDIENSKETCNFELSAGNLNAASVINDPPRAVMTFSPDGARIAITEYRTGNLRIWDTRTGKQLFQRVEEGRIFRVFFTTNGNRVVYTYGDPGIPGAQRTPANFGYKSN